MNIFTVIFVIFLALSGGFLGIFLAKETKRWLTITSGICAMIFICLAIVFAIIGNH